MTFNAWWANATEEERSKLAKACGTSEATLYQTAMGYRQNPKLYRAVDIERATKAMARRGLPAVTVYDLDTRTK